MHTIKYVLHKKKIYRANPSERSSRDVVANVLDCDIVVSSSFCRAITFPFGQILLGKLITPLYH